MHWYEAIASRPHSRVLNYLLEDEHQEFGPPTLPMIAAELGTDHKSTWNILRPLIEAGIVEMDAHPTGGAMYSFSGVLGEVG